MSLARRLFAPKANVSASAWDRPEAWVGSGLTSRRTTSGEVVSNDSALSHSAYWGCVTGISADIAKVPVSVVRSLDPRGRQPLPEHPVTRLLHDEANPECDAFTFRETLTQWAMTWGKGMAEIQRDGAGRPVALWPIHPSRIRLVRDVDGRLSGVAGALGWGVRSKDSIGKDVWIPDVDMFHVHGCGDGVEGWSVLRFGAESIGIALAAQTFSAAFFGNGVNPSVVFSLTKSLGDAELKKFHETIASSGTGKNAFGMLVLNGEGKLERLTMSPEDAQLLDTRKFSGEDVCRFFRRHPRKVGFTTEAAGWAKLDASQSEDVSDCLLPWWVRWERETNRKLLRGESGLSLKHYVQGLMRGDATTRAEYFGKRISSGTMTPNEVREIEDENPSDEPNADRLMVQGATILLGSLTEDPQSNRGANPIEPSHGPDEPAEPADPSTDPTGDGPVAKASDDPVKVDLSPIYIDAATRVVSKECAALDRAMKKHANDGPAFSSWCVEFYASQREYVASAFGPIATVLGAGGALTTLTATLWPDPVARTAEAFRESADALARALADKVRIELEASHGRADA